MARILLVEDSDALRGGVVRLLVGAGHEVVDVGRGKEAIAALENYLPDVVITDLNMPDMDGIEVIFGVQARLPGIPIIAMSGGGLLPPELLLDNATALGARFTVAKPFTSDELLGTVRRALAAESAE